MTSTMVIGGATSLVNSIGNASNDRIRQDATAMVEMNDDDKIIVRMGSADGKVEDDDSVGQEAIPVVEYNKINDIDGKVENNQLRTSYREALPVLVNNDENGNDNVSGIKITSVNDTDSVLRDVPTTMAKANGDDNVVAIDSGLRGTNGADSVIRVVLPDNNDRDDGIKEIHDSDLQKTLSLVVNNNINDNGSEDSHVKNNDDEKESRIRKRDKDNGQESMPVFVINNIHNKNVDDNGNDQKIPSERVSAEQDVECAWSWVVLVGLIVACIIGAGQVQCVNIYFVIFLEEFKMSTSFTAWISAAQATALCITGPLSSYLLPKMGARMTMRVGAILMATCLLLVHFATSVPYLIVVYACIGASQCLLTSGNLAALSLYFRRRASFATGIFLAGAGIGSMVTGLELEWSVEEFGWRGAMLIQAGIVLQICVCGSLVFDRNLPTKKEPKQPKADDPALRDNDGPPKASSVSKTSLKSLSVDPLFWLSVVSFVGLQSNFATMLTIFKGYVISVGLESSFKTVLTTLGLGSMVGRLLSGPIGHLLCPPLHMAVTAGVCALANALYILVDTSWALAVVGGIFGFCQGQIVVAYILSLSWVYGQNEMPIVRGNVIFFGILPGMLCPPIAGYTVDLTGNYNIALMMSSAATFCCGLCSLVIFFVQRQRGRRSSVSVASPPPSADVTPCVPV